jgi:GTP cyclohydrolase II
LAITEKTVLLTEYGEIECCYYHKSAKDFCLVLVKAPMEEIPFVRIQSSCLFSEAFHSSDCDCALQLEAARKEVAQRGGVIIYLFQEGRGIGLEGKMRAITLERTEGIDTAEAFNKLGFTPDPRAYDLAAEALAALGIGPEIVLATNNPKKIEEIEKHGFTVKSRFQLEYQTNPEIDRYLEMKRSALMHYETD